VLCSLLSWWRSNEEVRPLLGGGALSLKDAPIPRRGGTSLLLCGAPSLPSCFSVVASYLHVWLEMWLTPSPFVSSSWEVNSPLLGNCAPLVYKQVTPLLSLVNESLGLAWHCTLYCYTILE
jgi:hypothetical protein